MEKKNTDYSASAVNLTNPETVASYLTIYHTDCQSLADLQAQAAACVPPDLQAKIRDYQQSLTNAQQYLRTLIDSDGSYQDIERGIYAVKQRKVSISYNPQILRGKHPAEAALVIEEMVNGTKLAGLIKGGLLDLATLKAEGSSKETETFTYIIK